MNTSVLNTQSSALPNKKRSIEYYYGGPEAETLKASFVQMKRAASELRAGEHVLYINTLTSAREVERVAESISLRHQAKVLTYTVTSMTLAARLQFMSLTISAKKVRVIVLNMIDFAARTTNQKKALVHWLREMRDVHDCRVIVYGIHAPSDEGAMGQLKYLCERSLAHSQWNAKPVKDTTDLLSLEIPREHASDVAEKFVSELESELPVIEEEMVEDAGFIDDPLAARHVDFSAVDLNKINDLAGAYSPLRGEIKNEELRMKNVIRRMAKSPSRVILSEAE